MSRLNEVLGAVVAEQRRLIGLSQERLSFQCRRHRTYISQIERGLKSPTVRVLFDLARALNVAPAEIVRRTEEKLRARSSEPRES